MKVIFLVLFLVIECQCGVIDNVYGKIKNTTIGLKRDASNAWSYSKKLVGLDTRTPSQAQPGLIGGVLKSTQEALQSVRHYFWNPESLTDRGLLGNSFERVRNGLFDIRNLILPTNNGTKPTFTQNENTDLIKKLVNKLFYANGTRCVHGKPFKEAIEKLRQTLHEIRNNMTTTTTSPIHYGEGLIDIRKLPNITRTVKNIDDGVISEANDVYDKVDDF